MACESTSGWNGSDSDCQLSIVGGVIDISWVCGCFFLGAGTCFIEMEVVAGGGFQALRMPCLEWLAWLLAWLLEFGGIGTWLP